MSGTVMSPTLPHGVPAESAQQEIASLRAELEHQRLLTSELQHRSRNSLTIVQSLITSTLTDDCFLPDARDTLLARIGAMARANGLLTETEWQPMPLMHALTNALTHLERFDSRCSIEGPEVTVGPKAAVALALAFHELETNAIKYGALSNDAGHIEIRWSVVEDGKALRLTWTERNGPAVREPTRKGFGSRLTSTATARSLQGKAELAFIPSGVTWSLVAPLTAIRNASIN